MARKGRMSIALDKELHQWLRQHALDQSKLKGEYVSLEELVDEAVLNYKNEEENKK